MTSSIQGLAAAGHFAAPVFFIHAQNDYSLSSGKTLDARRKLIGKPHRLKIWEPDVFAFLDENMRR